MVHLFVRSEREGRVHRLAPVGELDIATVDIVEREFAAAHASDAAMIVVDLTELSFIDASGLHLLERMDKTIGAADRLRVISGSPTVDRLFELVDAAKHLPIIEKDTNPLTPLQRPPRMLAHD